MATRISTRIWDSIADGGYLSYCYGVSDHNWGNWPSARFLYHDTLVVMDSSESVRTALYPDYKSRRREKRALDPIKAAKYEKVYRFKQFLLWDPITRTLTFEGYEADDLVALLFLKGHGRRRVIGADKDLFQVPGLAAKLVDKNGARVPFHFKLPLYAKAPTCPGDMLFQHCLFGDKSDSIPRLLPSHPTLAKELYQGLDTSLLAAAKRFGDDFIRNLWLALVPFPTLRKNFEELYSDPELLLDLVQSAEYWDPRSFIDFELEEDDGTDAAPEEFSWNSGSGPGEGSEAASRKAQGQRGNLHLSLRSLTGSWKSVLAGS